MYTEIMKTKISKQASKKKSAVVSFSKQLLQFDFQIKWRSLPSSFEFNPTLVGRTSWNTCCSVIFKTEVYFEQSCFGKFADEYQTNTIKGYAINSKVIWNKLEEITY